MGELGSDSTKKTLLVYGHLDVQPAAIEDGWDTDPFVLTEKDGKLYGRGATDDKGPVLGWIHALQVEIIKIRLLELVLSKIFSLFWKFKLIHMQKK